jgi:hypothetical protein
MSLILLQSSPSFHDFASIFTIPPPTSCCRNSLAITLHQSFSLHFIFTIFTIIPPHHFAISILTIISPHLHHHFIIPPSPSLSFHHSASILTIITPLF